MSFATVETDVSRIATRYCKVSSGNSEVGEKTSGNKSGIRNN